jgi:hypothetical protein
MNMRVRGTARKCRRATGRTDGHRRSRPELAHQNRSGSYGRDLGWRPAGAADPAGGSRAGPAAEPVPSQAHEPGRSPLTDREAEP